MKNLKKEYQFEVIFTSQEEGGFTAEVPDLPGCISEGDTFEEAEENIQEAIGLYTEAPKRPKLFTEYLNTIDFESFKSFGKENPNVYPTPQLTGLTLSLTCLFEEPLFLHKELIFKLIDTFTKEMPKSMFRFYKNEHMNHYKSCSSRIFDTPKKWWEKGAKVKDLRYLEIHDGEHKHSLPLTGFLIKTHAEKNDFPRNVLRFLIEPHKNSDGFKLLLELAHHILNWMPILSARVGFSIESSPFNDISPPGLAYKLGIEHYGAALMEKRSEALGFTSLKTVSWLTLLGSSFLERVGGVAELRKKLKGSSAQIHECKFGVILQASDYPLLGDKKNRDFLEEYKVIYQALKPLFSEHMQPTLPLNPLGLVAEFPFGSDQEYSDKWYHRFAKKHSK